MYEICINKPFKAVLFCISMLHGNIEICFVKKSSAEHNEKTGKHFLNQIITTVKENNYIDHKKIATRNQLAQINNQASLRNNNLYAILFQCSCGNTHTHTHATRTNKHIVEKNFEMKLKKIRWRKKLFETKKKPSTIKPEAQTLLFQQKICIVRLFTSNC